MTDFGRRVGLGDMLKSVYDEDDDGAVNDSARLQGSSKSQVQDHAPQTHGHTMAFITGLITALAGKAPTVHTHTESEISNLVHDAQKIKCVPVDDTDKGEGKVLAYNATSGNLEYETAGAGESYVDRGDVSDWDWDKGDLIEDHNWYDLGAAAIVPDGASAIMFRVRVKEDTTGRILEIREKGNSNDINAAVITVDVANVQKDMCCIVACNAVGEVQYRMSSTVWTEIYILVKGWFI